MHRDRLPSFKGVAKGSALAHVVLCLALIVALACGEAPVPKPPPQTTSTVSESTISETETETETVETETATAETSEPLTRAAQLFDSGMAAFRKGEMPEAEEALTAALRLRQEEAPDSLPLTESLISVARCDRNRGDFDDAEAKLESARAIADVHEAGGRIAAVAHTELGIVAARRGGLPQAVAHYEEALARYAALGVDDGDVAMARMGLGAIAWERGDLLTAELQMRAAHATFAGETPDGPRTAWSLQGLGLVAKERWDFETAEVHFQQAIDILTAINPDGPDLGVALSNLGALAFRRGDYETARRHQERALAITERRLPGSVTISRLLANLGRSEHQAGRLLEAEDYLRRTLAIRRQQAPGSLAFAHSLHSLALVVAARGRQEEARQLHEEALAMQQQLAPGSTEEALTLHALGRLAEERGALEEALRRYYQAIEALETQRGRLGGTVEGRARFLADHADLYRDLLALLATRDENAAFHVLERYRAQGLAAMLADRDLDLDADLPPALAAAQREVGRAYEEVGAALRRLSAGSADRAEVERLRARRSELAAERQRLNEALRADAPRHAALTDPQPLDVEGARRALDPGTALLSYGVTETETFLFVLTADDPAAHLARLPIGEAALRQEVEAFRILLASPQAGPASTAALMRRGRSLYQQLVAPATPWLGGSSRLLIVPDGPLHYLPFAALRAGKGEDEHYLIADWPLHTAVSLTVYAALTTRPRAGVQAEAELAPRLAAFGDPAYPSAAPADNILLRGHQLAPLPSARLEVASIARLFGTGAHVYLGDQATEERARAEAPAARYLHFACHAFVDERFPLDSYLALSIPAASTTRSGPGGDNGLLHAWEIFEQVRLDAELVTLSACETGLGEEVGGEGLISLTRAFQHAGARSVLASLWAVADDSTSALISRFYTHLQAGLSKDEALRRAQLDLITGPLPPTLPNGLLARLRHALGREDKPEPLDARHPFHWAAFQLHGAWR